MGWLCDVLFNGTETTIFVFNIQRTIFFVKHQAYDGVWNRTIHQFFLKCILT
jgi:hypothetical protein